MIFISYRREDASGFAGRLHHSLTDHFGSSRVFRDIDTIAPGVDFGHVISESLNDCRGFVVVIGREWLVDLRGRRRLDDPGDWVRIEIETALSRDDVLVVPVLVEGASMPSPDDLPESLADLVRVNALELSDSRWNYDVQRLTTVLEKAVGPARSGVVTRLHRWLVPKGAGGAVARTAAAAAVLLGVALGVAHLLRPPPGPAPMTGDYKIAVAEFESLDGRGRRVESSEARDLAQSVHDVLGRELASISSDFELSLRPPAETGRIRGGTAAERADKAAALARRIGADVVVYGTLRTDRGNEFTPEFFLNDRQLQHAEELYGQHDLGSPIVTVGDIDRNPVLRNQLRDQILRRAKALAEFIVGLSYYGADQHRTAIEHFELARSATGWDERDGKEVLYLFLGNSAGKLQDLDRADDFYDAALALNPEYARARLGRAEVQLHRASGTCEAANADVDGLRTALDTFRSALSAKVQPAASDIRAKVTFSEARVHLCLSQADAGDYWSEAEEGFRQVIAEFTAGNSRIRELAAESRAGVAFIGLPAAGDPSAAQRYRDAAAEYQSAMDLIGDPDRKAFFSSMRGFIFTRLGERARADEAYALAVQLARDPVARARYEQAQRSLAP